MHIFERLEGRRRAWHGNDGGRLRRGLQSRAYYGVRELNPQYQELSNNAPGAQM